LLIALFEKPQFAQMMGVAGGVQGRGVLPVGAVIIMDDPAGAYGQDADRCMRLAAAPGVGQTVLMSSWQLVQIITGNTFYNAAGRVRPAE
jgi:hypothetical protein